MAVPPACLLLLLLWTLTANVRCADDAQQANITVKSVSGGIVLSCTNKFYNMTKDGKMVPDNKLLYEDENSGEYWFGPDPENPETKIFVKFRTCDNCVEMDTQAIAGIAVGNVVATLVIGWGVYIVTSQLGSTVKKSSDQQNFGRTEMQTRGPMSPNDHYQELNTKRSREVYDELIGHR